MTVVQQAQPQKRSRPKEADSPGMRMRTSDYIWCYIFILPFVIFFIAFTIWPLVGTVGFSLFNYDGMGPLTDFIGLDNYRYVLQDKTFLLSFANTILFAIANTVIKLPLSFAMAYLLTRHWLKGKAIFRTVFFLPLVVPTAIVGMVFTFLLNPANGAVNDVLKDIGLIERSINFFANREIGLWTIVLVSVWGIFGQYMIYWMAALQSVQEELYEAAEIDGANEWEKVIHITLPIIRPLAVIITFIALVNALKIFELVLTMTGGGPGSQTYVMSYFIYNRGFAAQPPRYGVASAASVIFGVTTLVAMGIQAIAMMRAQKTRQDYGV